MPEADHLAAAEQCSIRTTDPIALNLFRQLREMSVCDRRLVLVTLDGCLTGASSERVVLARSAVERCAAETAQPLSKKRYERWRVAHPERAALPSATQIARTWNSSWANAMDKLGVRPAPDHAVRRMARLGVIPSDEELLELLRICARDIGGTPRVLDYRRWRQLRLQQHAGVVFGEQIYRRRFGTWHKAIGAAGLSVRALPHRVISTEWTSEEALGYLREATKTAAGNRLRVSQYVAWRREYLSAQAASGKHPAVPNCDAIRRRFGSWLGALAAAGVISDRAAVNLHVGYGGRFTDAELDDVLARFAHETDGRPSSCAYQRWCNTTMQREPDTHLPGRSAVANRLDGWTNAAQRIREHRNHGRAT